MESYQGVDAFLERGLFKTGQLPWMNIITSQIKVNKPEFDNITLYSAVPRGHLLTSSFVFWIPSSLGFAPIIRIENKLYSRLVRDL